MTDLNGGSLYVPMLRREQRGKRDAYNEVGSPNTKRFDDDVDDSDDCGVDDDDDGTLASSFLDLLCVFSYCIGRHITFISNEVVTEILLSTLCLFFSCLSPLFLKQFINSLCFLPSSFFTFCDNSLSNNSKLYKEMMVGMFIKIII